MATRKTTKPEPMCVLILDYHDYFIPLKAALTVADLMSRATKVEHRRVCGVYHYVKDGDPTVEFRSVKEGQVITPEEAAKLEKEAVDHEG